MWIAPLAFRSLGQRVALLLGFHRQARYLRRQAFVLGLLLLGIGDSHALVAADYADLVNHCPSAAVQNSLAARRGTNDLRFRFQPIEEAKGGQPTNLDLYQVEITQMPTLPGSTAPATASALYEHFRINLASFLDEANSEFGPYDNSTDGKAWSKYDPTGALMRFDINNKLGAVPLKPKGDRIERALVLVTYSKRDADRLAWRFSTVGASDTLTLDFSAFGDHPVSGTREFGLRRRAGAWILYTRGVDRATGGVVDRLSRKDIFAGADDLWKSFQERAVNFVNAHGGRAAVVAPEREEPAWRDLVSQGVARLDCKWSKEAVQWASIGERESQALLSVRMLGDSTGLTSAILASATKQLKEAKTKQARHDVFGRVEAAAVALRAASTPKDVRDLVGSSLGTSLALSQAPFRMVPQTLEPGRLDGRDAELVKRFASTLLKDKGVGLRAGDAQMLLEAVVGRSLPAGLDSYVRTDPATEPVVRGLVAVVSRTGGSPATAQQLVDQLAPLTQGLLNEKARDISARIQQFQSMQQAVATARGAIGKISDVTSAANVQGVAAAVSTLVQNDLLPLSPEIKRQVGESLQVVSSGIRAYQALSLAADIASGSALVSAMGMLASGGDLGGMLGPPQDQGAKETLKAINELAAEVRRQFEVVNFKLDHISRQLDTLQTAVNALAGEVKELKEQQKLALAKLDTIAEDVRHLSVRVDELEDSLLKAIRGMSELDIDCVNNVRNRERPDPSTTRFENCLDFFARLGANHLGARDFNLAPSKVLINRFATAVDMRPGDSARYAWAVAVESARVLADGNLKMYGDPLEADKVANGPVAAHVADLYVAMVRRWGRSHMLKPHVHEDMIKHWEFAGLRDAVEAPVVLQSKLRGSSNQRESRALSIVEQMREPSVAAVAAWTEARAAALTDMATDARTHDDRLDVGDYPVRRCDQPNGPVLFQISGEEAKGILPRSALARGGATIFPDRQERWLDRAVICLFDVKRETRSGGERWSNGSTRAGDGAILWSISEASIRAKVRVDFLGISLGSKGEQVVGPFTQDSVTLRRGRDRSGPSDDERLRDLKGQFVDRLREVLQSDRTSDELTASPLRNAVTQALDRLPSARVQRIAASRAGSKLDATLAPTEDQRKVALGLVRGYFSIAYPHLYATSERLRTSLDGSNVVRIVDGEFFRQLSACSAAILADQENNPTAWTDETSSAAFAQLIKGKSGETHVCKGFSSDGSEFKAVALQNMQHVAGTRIDELRKALRAEKLDSSEREELMSANEAQMSAIRLREFEEHGGKASYYTASY